MTLFKEGKGRSKAPLTPWKQKSKKEKKALPGIASLDGRWDFEGLTEDNAFGEFED